MANDTYAPGACNIGPAETARRLRGAWVAVGGTVFLAVALYLVDASPIWQLTVAFPASLAAISFMQARMHFCAYFGLSGLYNFDELGQAQKVILKDAQRKDRRRSLGMVAASGAIGVCVGVASVAIAYTLSP